MLWLFSKKRRRERAIRKWQESRLIYEFFDGENTRRVDPAVIARRLEQHGEYRADVHIPLAEKGDEKAVQIVLSAIREAFGLSVFDSTSGVGLTETELIDLLTDFSLWVDELKKKQPNLPTPPRPTESTSTESGEAITPPGTG